MAYTEHGYQNYELYNVTDLSNPANLNLFVIDPSSNTNHVVASVNAGGSIRVLDLQGDFVIGGNTLADVTGTMSSITSYKDGSIFWADTFSNGANFQTWVADYAYDLSLLSGNDTFTGTYAFAINDAVQALDGNDVFTGYGDTNGNNQYGGGDHFYGGNGIDTSVYQGSMGQYVISTDVSISDARTDYTSSNTGVVVTDLVSHRDGLDRLVDVERLKFSDTMVGLDVGAAGHTGQIYRLYLSTLGRDPAADPDGCGFWIYQRDQGTSLNAIINGFLTSPEFVERFGSETSSNEAFVNLLYQNMLGRDGTVDPGFDFWTGVLNRGDATRSQVVEGFMESPENVAAVAPIIGNTPTYHEWVG
jgi:hypothetical protein